MARRRFPRPAAGVDAPEPQCRGVGAILRSVRDSKRIGAVNLDLMETVARISKALPSALSAT
jgi:hypothetical protein